MNRLFLFRKSAEIFEFKIQGFLGHPVAQLLQKNTTAMWDCKKDKE